VLTQIGEGLAAMPDGHHACTAIQRLVKVLPLYKRPLASVKVHARCHPAQQVGPGFLGETQLGCNPAGCDGVPSRAERSSHGVAHLGEYDPAWPSTADSRILSWRARTTRMPSRWCSPKAVEPSMSVKRNVTVPEGSSAIRTAVRSLSRANATGREMGVSGLVRLLGMDEERSPVITMGRHPRR
jgi:hypothetical protein